MQVLGMCIVRLTDLWSSSGWYPSAWHVYSEACGFVD